MAMDAGEFRSLLERHQGMVFSIAVRLLRDRSVAEEVAQDVFLELYRTAERLEGEDHVRFWLRRVAVHRATDALRRRARQPEAGAEAWMEEEHGAYRGDGAGGPGMGGMNGDGLSAGLAHQLEVAVGTLPEAMRVAVVLRYTEEMTPDEISRLLGQPLPTVKSNLQRGLKLLRQKAAVTMKEYIRDERA